MKISIVVVWMTSVEGNISNVLVLEAEEILVTNWILFVGISRVAHNN